MWLVCGEADPTTKVIPHLKNLTHSPAPLRIRLTELALIVPAIAALGTLIATLIATKLVERS